MNVIPSSFPDRDISLDELYTLECQTLIGVRATGKIFDLISTRQPLPAVASPTIDSPSYVLESDPEEDPEEDDEEDHEEDTVDYPADKEDNSDDEDESSDDDE
ncbi:hypothetical protein Tco_0831652 [Tanacetum coccineum]